jgi:hypothetical protein
MKAAARARAARLRRSALKYYQARIRPRLPAIGFPVCNGVVVARPRRLLDPLLPRSWNPEIISEDLPHYESALVDAMRKEVQPGDRVAIVGGGYGVTLVTAARRAGPGGYIVCYEPVGRRVIDMQDAVRMNGVQTTVEFVQAVVERAVALFGPGWNAPVLPATHIPRCDVLEMDCEGAEIDVLQGLSFRPRVIAVETHGYLGSPSATVRKVLEEMAYTVEDHGPAEADAHDFCEERDIRVLVGRLREEEQ